jgi:glycerol-3-phosphate acyltransferase PlsY
MWVQVVFVFAAYLFGSLPVLYFIGRLRGVDLRGEDMHQGLWRKVGYAEGLTGILWDIAKGAIPPLIALWLDLGLTTACLSALAMVAGQMWPVFLRFEGEGGNTTGIGAAWGLTGGLPCPGLLPFLIPIVSGAFARLALSLRTPERFKFSGQSIVMPLGMGTGFAILPLLSWCFYPQDMALTWLLLGLFLLIIIKRLTAGLREDLKSGGDKKGILLNRFLFDRSYR